MALDHLHICASCSTRTFTSSHKFDVCPMCKQPYGYGCDWSPEEQAQMDKLDVSELIHATEEEEL